MAVFTPVAEHELKAWLADFDVGQLVELKGILTGIDNSNFFVTTSGSSVASGRLVLTLFENLSEQELPFNLGLMSHLAHHGIPAPCPVPDRAGRTLRTLNGKPAALVTRLHGHSDLAPSPEMCGKIGQMLARMHTAGRSYEPRQENPLGDAWMVEKSAAVAPFLDADQRRLLETEVAAQTSYDRSALPTGAIHADLFRDNVLWDSGQVSGVLDFYFSCTDALLYDLAITASDWCIDGNSDLDEQRLSRLLGGYRQLQPILDDELTAFPMMLRRAALRFWLSRLFDLYLPRPASLNTPKDPGQFERILIQLKKRA